MRKKLLLIFLAIFSVASLTQCQSESSKPTPTQAQPTKQPQSTKRANPQTPQSRKPGDKTPVIQYSTVPFDITLNKVPTGYKGHDLELLYKSLRKKLPERGEFETTEDYKKRIERVTKEPLFGQLTGQSTFATVLNLDSHWNLESNWVGYSNIEYDADHKVLKIDRGTGEAPLKVKDLKADADLRDKRRVIYTSNQQERTVRTYAGENAFGVKKQVIVKEREAYYLVFTNIVPRSLVL